MTKQLLLILLSYVAMNIVLVHFFTLAGCYFLFSRDDLLQKYFYKNNELLTSAIYVIFIMYIIYTLKHYDTFIWGITFFIYSPVAYEIFIKIESVIANSLKILIPLLMIIVLIFLNPILQNNIYFILATVFMALVAFYQLANIENTLHEIDKEIQSR